VFSFSGAVNLRCWADPARLLRPSRDRTNHSDLSSVARKR
jgi:hypothetical protein